jgi:hypothetical protein
VILGAAAGYTDNTLLKADGSTSHLTQATGIVVDDSNNMSSIGTIGSGAITSTGNIEGATLTEGGVAVLNNDEMDASAELIAIVDDETGTGALVFANTPTLVTPVIGAATGTGLDASGTISANLFAPDAADGADIGSTTLEFSDIYLADASVIKFGNDQDVTLTHVADTGLDINLALGILDDQSLILGTNDDWTVSYDETTNDRLEFTNIAGTDGDGDVYFDLNNPTNDSTFTITNSDATTEANLVVEGDITSSGAIKSTATGDSFLDLSNQAATPPTAGTNSIYFVNNQLFFKEGGAEVSPLSDNDSVTWQAGATTLDMSAVTNLVLPSTADASGEIGINNTTDVLTLGITDGAGSIYMSFDFTGIDGNDGYVMAWNDTSNIFEPQAQSGAGGDTSWDDLADPDAGQPAAWAMNGAGETTTFTMSADDTEWLFDFTAAFTTANSPDLFKIIQQTGNAQASTLLTLQASDSDVTVLEAGNGASNAVLISQSGAMTFAGTAGIVPLPVTTNTSDLGSATREYDELFLGDAGAIELGSDQDVTITHVPDVGITLASVAPDITLIDETAGDGTGNLLFSSGTAAADIVATIQADIANVATTFITLDGTNEKITLGKFLDTFELGHASDTTIARVSAGVVSVEGVNLASTAAPALTGETTIGDPGGVLLTDDNYIELDATADGMDDDEYNGVVIGGRNCGETLTQWDLVEIVNDVDPWHKADATAASGEYPAFGISVAACTDTNEARILVKGIVRNEGWTGLTPGAPIYLGETDGALTETAPSTANDAVQIVGWALSDSEIYFDFSRPYQLVE